MWKYASLAGRSPVFYLKTSIDVITNTVRNVIIIITYHTSSCQKLSYWPTNVTESGNRLKKHSWRSGDDCSCYKRTNIMSIMTNIMSSCHSTPVQITAFIHKVSGNAVQAFCLFPSVLIYFILNIFFLDNYLFNSVLVIMSGIY